MMHQKVRTDLWGYSKNEELTNEQLINEDYIGIRPAPGYPACPDHTQKETLFKLLDIKNNLKVKLTESFAMTPSSSVSGLYFSNPKASYFGVGKINKDQVIDYAERRGISIEEAEKWLAPNLSYSPKKAYNLFENDEKIKLPDLDFFVISKSPTKKCCFEYRRTTSRSVWGRYWKNQGFNYSFS